MKTVTIGFSKRKGFAPGSKFIRWYTNRPFSHTYFKFKEAMYVDSTIFHAVGNGITYISEYNFLENNEVIKEFSFEITDELYMLLMNICHQHASRDYGYLQNLGVFLTENLNKIGFKLKKNPIDDGINCSELMYYILTQVHGRWIVKDPNLITPADIYTFLVK